jgi:hypothetical protein
MTRRRTGRPVSSTTPSTAGTLQVLQVDPQVLAAAKRLAGGDHRRLHLLPDGSVVVENQPDWRTRRRPH